MRMPCSVFDPDILLTDVEAHARLRVASQHFARGGNVS